MRVPDTTTFEERGRIIKELREGLESSQAGESLALELVAKLETQWKMLYEWIKGWRLEPASDSRSALLRDWRADLILRKMKELEQD